MKKIKIKLYQIDTKRGAYKLFLPFKYKPIDASIYNKVFDGEVAIDVFDSGSELEQIFSHFNGVAGIFDDYHGRSMSVSDVVAIERSGRTEYWYCDNVGFEPCQFDEKKADVLRKFGGDPCVCSG